MSIANSYTAEASTVDGRNTAPAHVRKDPGVNSLFCKILSEKNKNSTFFSKICP